MVGRGSFLMVCVDHPRLRTSWRAIDRPYLFGLLDRGARGPLTLVLGPAGAGKTTLLTTWLDAPDAPAPAVRVALTTEHNDQVGFWTDILDEIGGSDAVPYDAPLAILQPTRHTRHELRRSLVTACRALHGDLVLALDDLDVITEPDVIGDLRAISEHCPRVHLVLTTRKRPAFAPARSRGYGRVLEIDATELTFSAYEVGGVLHAAGVPVDARTVETVHRETGGWPVEVGRTARRLARQLA